jgi:hypothetical protein
MSFVKNTLSLLAQTIPALLVWGDSLRSRISGNNPYQSLRRDLCETGRGRPGNMLALQSQSPAASGAPSQALRNGYEDRKAFAFASTTYPAIPEILSPRNVGTVISSSGIPEEPSAPLTRIVSLTGPNHIPSNTNGKQITGQSKPPSRKSLRRAQSQSQSEQQSSGQSTGQRRKQQWAHSQPQSQQQWLLAV